MHSELLIDLEEFMTDVVDGIPTLTIKIKHPSFKDIKEFKNSLNNLLSDHKKIIIDFSNCDFIDSVILGAVVIVHKQLQKQGGGILTITSPGKMRFLFGQTGLDRVVKNFDNIEEALASIHI